MHQVLTFTVTITTIALFGVWASTAYLASKLG